MTAALVIGLTLAGLGMVLVLWCAIRIGARPTPENPDGGERKRQQEQRTPRDGGADRPDSSWGILERQEGNRL